MITRYSQTRTVPHAIQRVMDEVDSPTPVSAFAAGSERKKMWPLSILLSAFLMEMTIAYKHTDTGAHTHRHTVWEQVKAMAHKGGRLTSERAPGSHTSQGETINEKAMQPPPHSPLPPSLSLFKAKCPELL